MLPRMKSVTPLDNYQIDVVFDDGERRIYDVKEDIDQIKSFHDLKDVPGLFQSLQMDSSRTCVVWNDMIDLPSDTILEYGKKVSCTS